MVASFGLLQIKSSKFLLCISLNSLVMSPILRKFISTRGLLNGYQTAGENSRVR